MALDEESKKRGVVAVSAGNHGIAVSFAAEELGVKARILMPKQVSPVRIAECRGRAAEVELVESLADGFEKAAEYQKQGLSFVHPFEGADVAAGTGTLGLEFLDQITEPLDAVVISIGGGGLAGGVAAAIRHRMPECQIYGVEPEGAPTLLRSIEAGKPEKLPGISTIADSLSVPYAMPYSFSLCRKYLDEIVLVDDDALSAGEFPICSTI